MTKIKCPRCGHENKVEIPKDRCLAFIVCEKCKEIIKSKSGCVVCEYSDEKCPAPC